LRNHTSGGINDGLGVIKRSLRSRINYYRKRAYEIESYLSHNIDHWGKFQNEFNSEVNDFFKDIMDFEKVNMTNGHRDKIIKLKRLFVNRIRKLFLRGMYIAWSLHKPYGYAGDFKIINDIYRNDPSTSGFDRLFDNYYQMSAISVAVRNRKEDFKRLLVEFINKRKKTPLKIMNLACGSALEIKEMLSSGALVNKNVEFFCYDNDGKAIEYAQSLAREFSNVHFMKKNVLRIASAMDDPSNREKYDLIYSTGFFDYLSSKVGVRVIRNLARLLKRRGILAVSNVRDKYSNPSVHFMEWVGDWNLAYRTDDEFKRMFIDAGFKDNELSMQYEQQGIMQYIFAQNTRGA
ncbi:MAG: methyltransferase domain-containing protein, partial [bacterium]